MSDIKKSAEISPDGLYRYSLERTWDEDKPTVLFVCLNPSTADAVEDDATCPPYDQFCPSIWRRPAFSWESLCLQIENRNDLIKAADRWTRKR